MEKRRWNPLFNSIFNVAIFILMTIYADFGEFFFSLFSLKSFIWPFVIPFAILWERHKKKRTCPFLVGCLWAEIKLKNCQVLKVMGKHMTDPEIFSHFHDNNISFPMAQYSFRKLIFFFLTTLLRFFHSLAPEKKTGVWIKSIITWIQFSLLTRIQNWGRRR